jgi:hypothetical protein
MQLVQIVAGHAEGARPAGAVSRGTAPFGDDAVAIAEHQLLDQGSVGRITGHRQIGLGRLTLEQTPLGFLHRGEHGRLATPVLVDAD